MTITTFIFKNALRNKRRAALSVLSVAVSLFLFVTLLVVLREFTVPPEDAGASLRIAVRNKVSLGVPLPVRQRPTLEKIPGVAGVVPFTYFGGKYRGDDFTTFAQFATDAEGFPAVFTDVVKKMTSEDLEAWRKDRTTCIVGQDTMKRFGLKPGDRMQLSGTFYPVDLDMKIVGTYSGTMDDRTVFFHQKHLDELMGGAATVGTWWVRADSAEVASQVIGDINRAFANTSAEVRAETERAFQLGFVSMWGNIKLLIGSICTVVVFTLLLVTVSTMSMAIRERFRELAVLKAIGFRRHELFAFILAESFGLSVLGAIVGAGGAYAFFHSIDIQKLSGGVFVYFEVTPRMLGLSFLVATVLGIIASIQPAVSVARTSVVDGLKTLD